MIKFVCVNLILVVVLFASTNAAASEKKDLIERAAIHEAAHYVYYVKTDNNPAKITSIRLVDELHGENEILSTNLKFFAAVYMSGYYVEWLLSYDVNKTTQDSFNDFISYYKHSSDYQQFQALYMNYAKNNKATSLLNELQHAKFYIERHFVQLFPKIKRLAIHLQKNRVISGEKAHQITFGS